MKRMLTRKPFSKMEGLTLLETMFALAVGALVLIGAVIFYMSTKQSANVSKTVGDMNAIVSAYQSYMAGGNTVGTGTDSVTITMLQNGGYLPISGTVGKINDAWGLPYDIVFTPAGPTTVAITVTGLGAPGTSAAIGDKNCYAIVQAVGNAATADASTCKFTYTL